MNVQRLHVLELSTASIRVTDSFGCDENFRNNQWKLEQNAFQNWYKMFNYMIVHLSFWCQDLWIERLIPQIVARKEGSLSDECGTKVCYKVQSYITRIKSLTSKLVNRVLHSSYTVQFTSTSACLIDPNWLHLKSEMGFRRMERLYRIFLAFLEL